MESPELENTDKETKNLNLDDIIQSVTKPNERVSVPEDIKKIQDSQKKPLRTYSTGGSSEKPSPHETGFRTFGRVFANPLGKTAVEKNNASFPEGSIFVREKLLKETDSNPETITAMVKREKGFSKKTNDWEFFTFNGADLKLQKRQTKSDCSKCHAQAKDTDFVFKTYLK